MKAPTILFVCAVWVWAAACSSGPSERKSSLEESQERMQGEGSGPHGDRPGPGVPAVAEPGPVENDFDQDRDGISDADEANDPEQDNTAMNERAPDAPTPLDQSSSSSDLEITQAIRKKVVGDDDLSFNAKNVKIITVGGKVTLRGPVESTEERTTIESSARSIPGVAKVDNQLQVKR
jgi:hyperosmotically inducible protein